MSLILKKYNQGWKFYCDVEKKYYGIQFDTKEDIKKE